MLNNCTNLRRIVIQSALQCFDMIIFLLVLGYSFVSGFVHCCAELWLNVHIIHFQHQPLQLETFTVI
jgi:hypothetical protein